MRKQPHEHYQGFRMPGIRLMEAITPNVAEHRSEKYLETLDIVYRFDKAHLVMLTEEGLIPRADGVAMLRALREMEQAGVEQTRLAVQGGTHSGEQYLIRTLSEEVGGRIHLGRSSGDLAAVTNHAYWRDQLLLLVERINRYRRVLLAAAEQHLETVMPATSTANRPNPRPTASSCWPGSWPSVGTSPVPARPSDASTSARRARRS